jgi:type IV secretion system protein VirB10
MSAADTIPEKDIRPLVGRAINNRSLWIFGGILALAAFGLFLALEGRRATITSPTTMPSAEPINGMIAPPPDLAMPDDFTAETFAFQQSANPPAPTVPRLVPQTLPGVPNTPNLGPSYRIPSAPIVRAPSYVGADSPDAVVSPRVPAPVATYADIDDGPAQPRLAGASATITRLANPSTTIPQGALIQAVLETALDSSRPGFARAIVSRDVRSFDGTRILIPRGSRLFGEYKADVVDGQNRAFVLWQKLTRPDGVQIAIESPAADPLGRAGVRGKVNTHFFERFAGSILQSALDVGVGVATRSASNGTVIVGLPGSSQTTINPEQTKIRPTLKVKHGTSVSVFVARDLDFTAAE